MVLDMVLVSRSILATACSMTTVFANDFDLKCTFASCRFASRFELRRVLALRVYLNIETAFALNFVMSFAFTADVYTALKPMKICSEGNL